MRFLLKPFQLLYSLYAIVTFIALMIPVFVWALLVLLLGRGDRGNLIYPACTLWGDVWFVLIGVRHRNIYETNADRKAAYIYVSNHISYFDIPSLVKTFRRPVRPLGKAETAKVPIFGLIYRNTIVTVDRSSPENRARSVRLLKQTLQKGISVLVFPEGTFNETGKPLKSFYDGAFRIAIETGTPIQPVLMPDTYRRMHYRSVFSLTPGRNRAIFLEPVPVDGLGFDDIGRLKQEVFDRMERRLIELGAEWIGEEAPGKPPADS
ncbi:lysophospholipid acyltransferase family protein [Flaviaesturariibacter amylovorans]|uniref:Phospholipid/glycerol acyltransferase domain-containing protein n=1 Tax=Flaviaesturariibacter amylovorans TaxID=1084520 RepID=A0ABP8GP79_9BACT